MTRNRRHFSGAEKVAILRRHLIDAVPISELCSEYGLAPTCFYRCQKQFFENGAAAFEAQQAPARHSGDAKSVSGSQIRRSQFGGQLQPPSS